MTSYMDEVAVFMLIRASVAHTALPRDNDRIAAITSEIGPLPAKPGPYSRV